MSQHITRLLSVWAAVPAMVAHLLACYFTNLALGLDSPAVVYTLKVRSFVLCLSALPSHLVWEWRGAAWRVAVGARFFRVLVWLRVGR